MVKLHPFHVYWLVWVCISRQREKLPSTRSIPLDSDANLLKHLLDKYQSIFLTHCGTTGQALILPTCEAQDTPHAFMGRLSECLSSAWGNGGYIIKYSTANNLLQSVNIICLILVTHSLDLPWRHLLIGCWGLKRLPELALGLRCPAGNFWFSEV